MIFNESAFLRKRVWRRLSDYAGLRVTLIVVSIGWTLSRLYQGEYCIVMLSSVSVSSYFESRDHNLVVESVT